MHSVQKFMWGLGHPRSAFKNVLDHLRYPAYKYHVGPPELYEALGRYQFDLLRTFGLRPNHAMVDVGCGSLRAGKFFIRYLEPGNYAGIEPNVQILEEGIRRNLDQVTHKEKKPSFNNDENFTLSIFNRRFDFLLAHSILTHAAQHQIEHCFAEARKVMTETSLFFANYNRGESNYSGTKWVYPGADCDGAFHGAITYTPARISSLAQSAGLHCVELDIAHPTGSSWVVLGERGCLRDLGDGRVLHRNANF